MHFACKPRRCDDVRGAVVRNQAHEETGAVTCEKVICAARNKLGRFEDEVRMRPLNVSRKHMPWFLTFHDSPEQAPRAVLSKAGETS